LSQTFATSFQDVHRAELISQPAVERVILTPRNARDSSKVKNRVLPINRFSYRAIVSNVSPNFFTRQAFTVGIEPLVKESNSVALPCQPLREVASDETVSSRYQNLRD